MGKFTPKNGLLEQRALNLSYSIKMFVVRAKHESTIFDEFTNAE